MELEKCKTFDIKVEQVFVKLDVVFFRLKKFCFEAFILRIEQSMKALLSFDVKNFFFYFLLLRFQFSGFNDLRIITTLIVHKKFKMVVFRYLVFLYEVKCKNSIDLWKILVYHKFELRKRTSKVNILTC